MNWNHVATLEIKTNVDSKITGSIAYLPTGAVDESGTLRVMWGDKNSHVLSYFHHPLAKGGTSSVVPIPIRLYEEEPEKTSQAPLVMTSVSPCLVYAGGPLVAMWVEVSAQSTVARWGKLDPESGLLEKIADIGNTPAGVQGAYFPEDDCLFTGYGAELPRQVSGHDSTLLLRHIRLTGLDRSDLQISAKRSFGEDFRSYYSPAAAAMPNGHVAVVFKGIGKPGEGKADNNLYFASAPNPWAPEFPNPAPVKYGGATATSMNRPSLTLHGTGSAATLVVVYPGTSPGQLNYLVGTPDGTAVEWAAPPQGGTTDGTVPLRDLLGVELTNPVGVWVNAPDRRDTRYLLVGDTHNDTIAGTLYLIRYMGGS
jgi:hypothetical protein